MAISLREEEETSGHHQAHNREGVCTRSFNSQTALRPVSRAMLRICERPMPRSASSRFDSLLSSLNVARYTRRCVRRVSIAESSAVKRSANVGADVVFTYAISAPRYFVRG